MADLALRREPNADISCQRISFRCIFVDFYNILGNTTKHIFANAQPVADIISATSSSSGTIKL
jgi:hypothetical protein